MRKLIILPILLLAVFSAAPSIFAQQEPAKEQPAAEAPAQKLVTALEIKGNKSISTNTIASKMKTRMGDYYQETVASDDLKRLYLLGFFSDIKMDTEEYKNGVKVIVTVTERPLIEKITFAGITRLTWKDEKLKAQLKSKEGQYLDYPTLDEDIGVISKLYEKIGFSEATITYSVDTDKETNKARVQFNAVEGQKIRIKAIIIEGNKSFSAGRIRGLLKTKPAWLFNAGALKDDVLTEDIERVKAFYRKQGFSDVTAEYDTKPDGKKPYLLYITIKVEEGRKYLVGTVSVQGNKVILEKEILSKLSECIPGKVYSEEGMNQDISSVQGLYFDRGYISNRVQEATLVNSDTGRVDISYSIIENDVAYVSKIKVKGNIKTRDLVIRRELRIHPGDKFDGAKLRRSKERLQNLGYFDEVSYDTEDTDVPDKKDLVVDVKETKTGAFSFGGGYSTVDSFVGFVEVEQKNFDWKNFPYFTGGGQDLKFRASLGSLTNSFDISFTNPYVFDYPYSFGFDIYRREHKRDTDTGYGYDEKVTGGDLRLGKEISDYTRVNLTYRLDEIDISNPSDGASVDLMDEVGKNRISSLTPGLTYDSRDNVFDPHKGDLVTGSFEWAGGMLGGDKDYWKMFTRASHYFPMPWKSVIEVKGRVGLGDVYDNTDSIPIYERFFAGGASTIRGYEERTIGPYDPSTKDPLGGASMFVANVEYTYPLFSFLKVATFFDIGNVWEKMEDFGSNSDTDNNTGKLKKSFGLGVRVKTPIGPISLDYGFPLDKQPGEDDIGSGRLHFSASHGF